MTHQSSHGVQNELDEETRIAGLTMLWEEVNRNFVNFDLAPDIDWDALYRENLPLVRHVSSRREYYKILTSLVAKLRDGHTNVLPPEELAQETHGQPPLVTRWIEERIFVTEILDREVECAGITKGEEVLAVDGVPIHEHAEKTVMPYVSASTPQDLRVRTFERFLLAGPTDLKVELRLRSGSAGEVVRLLPRICYEEWRERLAVQHPSVELRRLPGNIAHVVINTFESGEVVSRFEALFPEIAQASALLLDVRNNGGGDTWVGFHLLGRLTSQRCLVGRWRKRRRTSLSWKDDLFHQGETWLEPVAGRPPFTGPVAVLISPRTYSAAEDFVMAFDAMNRGLLVGEPTGGCTGQPLLFPLPGGGWVRVCSRRDTYPDGREFVGIGIQPDCLVHPTIDDFLSERDPVLEAALRDIFL